MQRLLNNYPNYSTRRLYFEEVDAPYRLFFYPKLAVLKGLYFLSCGTLNLLGRTDDILPQGGRLASLSFARYKAYIYTPLARMEYRRSTPAHLPFRELRVFICCESVLG